MYKQQAKHCLLLKSPIHIPRYCSELEVPVTINSTCLMNAIHNILNGMHCYHSLLRDSGIKVLTYGTRASTS